MYEALHALSPFQYSIRDAVGQRQEEERRYQDAFNTLLEMQPGADGGLDQAR